MIKMNRIDAYKVGTAKRRERINALKEQELAKTTKKAKPKAKSTLTKTE